jgi:PcfJ-like protein
MPADVARVDITALATFCGLNKECFNEKWTLTQARTACTLWALAHTVWAITARSFCTKYHIGWRDPIDYSPLHLHYDVGEFEFVALRSGEHIFAEGENMQHCAFQYMSEVLHGTSRLFSIRRNGHCLATLELRKKLSSSRSPSRLLYWATSR